VWQDRLAAEVVRTAQAADALGYGEIWIGEMATFDAFALGAVVAERTSRASLTIGPLAVAVRDPVMIAMGAGSLAELTGRTVNVALGSSSPMFAEAGFEDVVRFARTGPRPGELLAAIPAELVGHVSLTGDEQAVRARMAEYGCAGVDEVALVPGSSDADPAGVATLTALAP
jgi:alkanesulfonate monooxygenase SsuD/methylene tetrahydromethanopterin reductase-like flavin-dependent oxidoreductase (luciferase family)